MKIAQISLAASFENIARAKEQFDAAEQLFIQKYGKGNVSAHYSTSTENCTTPWRKPTLPIFKGNSMSRYFPMQEIEKLYILL